MHPFMNSHSLSTSSVNKFSYVIKNRKGNRRTRFPKFTTSVSLRWHYPHQVYGSKFATSSQPVYKLPCFLIDVTIKLFFKIVNRFFRVTKLKIEFLCFFEILPKRRWNVFICLQILIYKTCRFIWFDFELVFLNITF